MLDPFLDLTNLEALKPGLCNENCDSFLIKICNKLKNLTEFQSHIRRLTDVGVLALTNREKSWEKIALDNCHGWCQITDNSIKKFKNLQKIFLSNYPKITDDSIIAILNNSPNIEFIHLEKTGITFKTVQHVIDTMRNRKNDTRLVAEFDLPDDTSKLQGNMPSNLDLNLQKVSK